MEQITYHHTMPIQLRWMDADAFGHVNNAMYFQYYDTAKMDYFRKVCPEIVDKYAIVTVHLEADFLHQVYTKDEEVEVQTAIVHIGHSSFTFQQQLVGKNDHEVKCVGQTIMVLFDIEKEQKVMFTPQWREAIGKFEGRKF
jgi:acyl-CoA thioester hydrolase